MYKPRHLDRILYNELVSRSLMSDLKGYWQILGGGKVLSIVILIEVTDLILPISVLERAQSTIEHSSANVQF